MFVEFSVGITGHPSHGDSPCDVLEVLAEVDAGDGDVGAPLPGAVLWAEGGDLGVGAGLVPVQPGDVVPGPALLLHLAPLRRLNTTRYHRELLPPRQKFQEVLSSQVLVAGGK